ncbi:glutamyl-tRNA reductase [Echinicola vietnamensis]|uniref:Glutamyl-tRNA reductase n=1 Tax=Echinicola vietnamensis (strain DSM 17526 / LMG 23754 / KMM 6221) TaxID=926556 RepID=L0G089_ECHVK|nr:glutamyl-tRNA reductase [Echinicola vietnamensis]AGA78708.1 glutamyl-tRNA reductase [Echinicola vietnamensis DSM 17526]
MIQFRLLSLSHKTTDIAVRERFALNINEVSQFLSKAKEVLEVEEVIAISTCNRTEILFFGEESGAYALLDCLCQVKQQNIATALEIFSQEHEEEAVLNYIFQVSSGLESQILGDAQIRSQIKQAYQLAHEAQATGTYTHRLLQVIFSANKRIASQTGFRSGISSASYAAVDMIEEYQSMFKSARIAVIGFGEMGQNVCKHLCSKGHTALTVFNRSHDKIAQFNDKFKTELAYLPLDLLPGEIHQFDIIISSPSVTAPILEKKDLQAKDVMFKILVDISIPRSIAPEVANVPGIMLYDMDDIGKVTQTAMEQKKASIQDVKTILNTYMEEFITWKNDNKNLASIRSMKAALQAIKAEEMDRYQRLMNEAPSCPYEKVMDAMIQKIIKKTVVTLKSIKDDKERKVYNSLINQTFL